MSVGTGEEVYRGDSFAVIAQKRQPALAELRVPGARLIQREMVDLRYVEAEHQKLAVNTRCTPGRVLGNHAEDQLADLLGDSPATAVILASVILFAVFGKATDSMMNSVGHRLLGHRAR